METEPQQLLDAAGNGDSKAVRDLLSTGMQVDAANDFGYTALMSAARSYRIELVDWLIKQGANVNAVTTDGQYVLHASVGETPSQPDRQAACVESLLNAGADPDVQTPAGHTPIMLAAWFGCAEAVKSFRAHNADTSLKDGKGLTALEIARNRGHNNIVEILPP